jgi:predicted Zn-dependent peptidase
MILGPKKNIISIKRDDLSSYIKTNSTADRLVLVGTGGVDHGELVKAAEKAFGMLPVSPNPIPLGRTAHPKPDFSSEASPSRVRPFFICFIYLFAHLKLLWPDL